MNRRTFTKYLLAAPIALATLLTRPLTSSVVSLKEKDEELGQEAEAGFNKPFRAYYDNLLGQKEELLWPCFITVNGVLYKSQDGIHWTENTLSPKIIYNFFTRMNEKEKKRIIKERSLALLCPPYQVMKILKPYGNLDNYLNPEYEPKKVNKAKII